MNESKQPAFSEAELEASLQGLGVTELEQRLEFSALLAGTFNAGTEETAASVCCSCKLPPDNIFGDDPVPIVAPDPTPGGDFWGTGPTDGMGW
jgi:hypothetical protein